MPCLDLILTFLYQNFTSIRYTICMRQYIYSSTIGLLLLTFFQFVTLSSPNQTLRVYFLDVGQGDAMLLRYPTGEDLLIDTGRDSKIFRELDKVLPWYDKTIDYVLLTHGDLDHLGAMSDILDRYAVKKVFVSNVFGDIEVEKNIAEKLKQKNEALEVLGEGDMLTFGTSIPNSFNIIHPDTNCFKKYKNENDCSLVVLIKYGTQNFLMTGDISSEVESQILSKLTDPITVLKVGHHGSKYSSSNEFLQKIKPIYSIISVGENSYGHPHPDVLKRLQSASSTIWSTKEAATIVAASDGTSLKVEKLFNQASFFQSSICSILLYSFDTSC